MNNNHPEPKRPKPNKRPSSAEIQGMLFEGNFSNPFNGGDALPVSDPVSITQMVLKLDEIRAYDKNPRQLLNPEYSSIKASIRNQRGLNNPFNVTRRPGGEHYMVQAGGNTRLKILRELYAETGDEAFNTVHCLYVPWKDEATVITAHMIENEMRGEMAMIDKAFGVQALRMELERERGSALSDNAFSKTVLALGYRLSTRQIRRLSYALELDKVIPQALREGLAYSLLDTIKNTEKAYHTFCAGKTERMPELFARNMAELDGEAFDFERVRSAIEDELGEILDVPSNRLSLQIDVLMLENAKTHDTVELLLEPREEYPDDDLGHERTMSPPGASTPNKLQPLLKVVARKPAVEGTEGYDLPTLQQQGFLLATDCAKSVGMARLVLQRTGGMGFVVEMPDIQPQDFTEWGIWWLLVGISEQNADQSHVALWQDTNLYKLYASDTLKGTGADGTNVRNFLGDPPNLQHFPFQVLNDPTILKQQDFKAVLKLMDNCRTIREHFTVDRLWPEF